MSVQAFVTALLRKAQASREELEDGTAYEGISVWRERRERENELVLKSYVMKRKAKNSDEAYEALSNAWLVTEQVASGELDVMHGSYGGFPILELMVGTLRRVPWFIYFSSAADKSCLLLLAERTNRELARHRALIWIEKCPNRHLHGHPVLIGLDGELLEPPPRSEQ